MYWRQFNQSDLWGPALTQKVQLSTRIVYNFPPLTQLYLLIHLSMHPLIYIPPSQSPYKFFSNSISVINISTRSSKSTRGQLSERKRFFTQVHLSADHDHLLFEDLLQNLACIAVTAAPSKQIFLHSEKQNRYSKASLSNKICSKISIHD